MRIIVVDDNELIAEIISVLLKRERGVSTCLCWRRDSTPQQK